MNSQTARNEEPSVCAELVNRHHLADLALKLAYEFFNGACVDLQSQVVTVTQYRSMVRPSISRVEANRCLSVAPVKGPASLLAVQDLKSGSRCEVFDTCGLGQA